MIPRIGPKKQNTNWQKLLADANWTAEDLANRLQFPADKFQGLDRVNKHFRLRVTESFVNRMELGNINDPLLLQILPDPDEQKNLPGFHSDPVGDLTYRSQANLLHKYQGRVLLLVTGACAIHCRYCFRQNFPYESSFRQNKQWQSSFEYIRSHKGISEVILSGGDPLVLETYKLATLCEELSHIPHVKRIRIHTRLPIVLPERIDNEFLEWIHRMDTPIIMVLHCNHANELDQQVQLAIERLKSSNYLTILNQSVVLKGINDTVAAQCQLQERLFDCGILPYYLHLLDKVSGSARFHVKRDAAILLHEAMRKQLPGYLLPRLVEEQASHPYKLPVY